MAIAMATLIGVRRITGRTSPRRVDGVIANYGNGKRRDRVYPADTEAPEAPAQSARRRLDDYSMLMSSALLMAPTVVSNTSHCA
ncbi:MAG: hypothetical protein ACI85K_002368 [Hyphomicrobiaceae bacterium]|jgi:hypothetical protein